MKCPNCGTRQTKIDPTETIRVKLDKLKKDTYNGRQERIKKFYAEKESHIKALAELKGMLHKTSDETNLNVLEYAIRQLEDVIPHDYKECYAERIDEIENMSLEAYIEHEINYISRDIVRYEKNLEEDDTRNVERLQAYLNLVNFVDNN